MDGRLTYMKVEVQGYLYKDVREIPQYDVNDKPLKPYYQFTLKIQRTRSYEYESMKKKNEVSYDLVEVTYRYDGGSQLLELTKGDLLKVVGYGAIQPEYTGAGKDRKIVTRGIVTKTGRLEIPVTKFVVRAQKVSRQARPAGVIEMEPQEAGIGDE